MQAGNPGKAAHCTPGKLREGGWECFHSFACAHPGRVGVGAGASSKFPVGIKAGWRLSDSGPGKSWASLALHIQYIWKVLCLHFKWARRPLSLSRTPDIAFHWKNTRSGIFNWLSCLVDLYPVFHVCPALESFWTLHIYLLECCKEVILSASSMALSETILFCIHVGFWT